MKRYVPLVIWFSAGAIVGQLAESVLFPFWLKFGPLMPVAHRLASFGHNMLVKYWCELCPNFPNWLLVAIVGVMAGVFVKRHLVLDLFLFGLGFAFVPLGLYDYLNSTVPSFHSLARRAVLVALAILCGLLSHRQASPPNKSLQATAGAPELER